MARICAQTIQTRTPISRQMALSSSSRFGAGILSTRNLYFSPRSSPSLSQTSRSSLRRYPHCKAAAIPPARWKGENSFIAASSNRLHAVSGLSPSHVLLLAGTARMHVSTGKGTTETEVEERNGFKIQKREILVQHLLVKEDETQLLVELKRLVHEGVALSDLATEHSACASKSRGGMIGWIKPGQTDPAFEEAAFNAPLNELVQVKTKHGWHLLQVLNERTPRVLEQLQVEDLQTRMQDPNFLEEVQLIDVRELDEISIASIEGFDAYPLSQFGQWGPTLLDKLDPEKDTFVLCHHGIRSMQAASWLQSQGFSRLYNIAGGIHAYAKRIDPTVPTY